MHTIDMYTIDIVGQTLLYFTGVWFPLELWATIILCLLFGIPVAARFDKLVEVQVSWASWPSIIKTPGWCRKLKNLYLGCL